MKILYVTTIGRTMGFFKSFIKQLLDEGHEVDIATNETESMVPDCYREWGCTIYPIDTSRVPLDKDNLTAIKQIKRIVSENKYDIVHCHTPIAAMCTRLACRKARKNGTKVFYTAHGFHFYKGALLKNWLLYYPVEKVCAHFTDVLITINQEDYALAQKKMKAKRVEYVPGVGIALSKFEKVQIDRNIKRHEIGVPEDAILLTSVGELIPRKNHKVVLDALANSDNKKIHYVIVGSGTLLSSLQALVKEHGIEQRVHFLGYRKDIAELYKASDVCCLPSIHEGLPVSLMEAMSCGLPVVCSKIRGNTDLIDENGGVLFDPNSVSDCKNAISKLLEGDLNTIGEYNKRKIKNFDVDNVNKIMTELYEILV